MNKNFRSTSFKMRLTGPSTNISLMKIYIDSLLLDDNTIKGDSNTIQIFSKYYGQDEIILEGRHSGPISADLFLFIQWSYLKDILVDLRELDLKTFDVNNFKLSHNIFLTENSDFTESLMGLDDITIDYLNPLREVYGRKELVKLFHKDDTLESTLVSKVFEYYDVELTVEKSYYKEAYKILLNKARNL